MKSEKGVTLISLIIYVIVMAVIIAVLSVISTFFYKNIKDINDIAPITEYTTFNSYFLEEINHSNIQVLECGSKDGQNYIIFSNGVQYTYVPENKGIYKNKVKICRDIDECTFTETIENGKNVVQVTYKAGTQQKNTKYILKN